MYYLYKVKQSLTNTSNMIFNYNTKDLTKLTRNQMYKILKDLEYIKNEIEDEEWKRGGVLIDLKNK